MRSRVLLAAAVALLVCIAGIVRFRLRQDSAPVPSTCIIGTDNAYPYHYLNSSGQAEGMIADVIQEAARRAHIQLDWRLLPEGPSRALESRKAQVWPLLSGRPDFWPSFHFTKPYLQNTYVILAVNPEFATPLGERRLRRLAIADLPLVTALAKRNFPGVELRGKKNREEALSALCLGEVDGALMESRAAQRVALVRPPDCVGTQLNTIGLNLPPTELGIASTPEAAPLADRLRAEIDGMLADGTMPRILRRWNYYYSGEAETIYRAQEAIAARRLSLTLAAVLGLLSILLLFSLERMRRAKRAALDANAAKSQFLANMSHEIRTPLHGILGVAQILADTPLQPEQNELLAMMQSSGRTLVGIVDDLLDLSRIERGRLVIQTGPFQPAPLIRDTLRVFEPQAVNKGVTLASQGLDALPPWALGDPVRIRQILSNLITNALKFTTMGTVRVEVRCQSVRGMPITLIAVTDTGIGIAPSGRARIFEKFVQADSSIGRRFGGTGLGLAICKELVETMGGTIGVESVLGRGSTFWFTLPLPPPQNVPNALPANGTGPSLMTVQTQEQNGTHRVARILLAEDNPVNQRIAKRLLERAGHEVTLAHDGESAIQEWQKVEFDAIFMDCHMPGLDGYQATGEIRKLEKGLRHTPIIALTAAAMSGERERCLKAGMDDYVTKPIDMAELSRVLDCWVEHRTLSRHADTAP